MADQTASSSWVTSGVYLVMRLDRRRDVFQLRQRGLRTRILLPEAASPDNARGAPILAVKLGCDVERHGQPLERGHYTPRDDVSRGKREQRQGKCLLKKDIHGVEPCFRLAGGA